MGNDKFHDKLKIKMDEFVHLVYRFTKDFPGSEIYGITSQLRRASLSVILNYIEGFARRKNRSNINFLEISYGSLKESEYLLEFCREEQFLNQDNYTKAAELANEIGAMLWTTIKNKESYL